jgi:hypothetical protein
MGGILIGMSSSNNATVTNVILEHVWVEAAIDYIPSGGRHMVEPDTWVALDAKFRDRREIPHETPGQALFESPGCRLSASPAAKFRTGW